MKLHSISYLKLLALAFTLSLLLGCSKQNEQTATDTSTQDTVASSTPTAADSADINTSGVSPDTSSTTGAVDPIGSTDPAPVTSTGGGTAGRSVSDSRFAYALEDIARNMEALDLAYRSDLGQDCSGIYHQLKDSIQARLPELADPAKYHYPAFRSDRNSRQIAAWYHRNNNLLIVQDALAERNEIRPGSVMFFGRTEENYSNLNIDLLVNPGKFVHDGTNGKIMHVAVVTSVEKDENGQVVKYTMMHGRNSKYPASRSAGNYDGPGGYVRAFSKFPFGNWNQQWVAMAHIETPK